MVRYTVLVIFTKYVLRLESLSIILLIYFSINCLFALHAAEMPIVT